MTRALRLCVASILLVGATVPAALADRRALQDETAASDSPTDMAWVVHDHGDGANILRHEVHFDGQPASVSEAVTLYFRFTSPKGNRVRRELAIRTNPDGGLYGAFTNARGRPMGFSRAWMDDPSTLVVEFSRRTLGRLKGGRYRWFVWSILGAGEFDEPCAPEDRGPPVCMDRAPATGSILHRL